MSKTEKPAPDRWSVENLTRIERNALLYAECCVVDHGGLLEGVRMNAEDHASFDVLQRAGFLEWGRIPAKLLAQGPVGSWKPTHWIRLTESGLKLAHECRRFRSNQVGPYATKVWEALEAREEGRRWRERKAEKAS